MLNLLCGLAKPYSNTADNIVSGANLTFASARNQVLHNPLSSRAPSHADPMATTPPRLAAGSSNNNNHALMTSNTTRKAVAVARRVKVAAAMVVVVASSTPKPLHMA